MRTFAVAICLLALAVSASAWGDKDWKTEPRPTSETGCLRRYYKRSWEKVKGCVGYTGSKGDYKGWTYHSNDKYPVCGCYTPSVYEFVSNHPNLTIAKTLVDLGLTPPLTGPFTGTLLLPTDAALTAYIAKMKVNPLDPAIAQYFKPYLAKVLSYHTLLRRVYSSQWSPVAPYSTVYKNVNRFPHKVTFVSNAASSYKGKDTSYTAAYLVDEQGNQVTFDKVDQIVLGGGVVHTINSVLEAGDIFTSLVDALTSSPNFSNITDLALKIDTILPGALGLLETTPGTLAVPNNAAFDGVPVGSLSNQFLVQTVMYHFCAVSKASDLLYYPFSYPAGKTGPLKATNPCLTLLTTGLPAVPGLGNPDFQQGLLYSAKVLPLPAPQTPPGPMKISFVTGTINTVVNAEAPIIVADISLPIHSLVVVTELIIPPTGLTNPPL